MAKAIRTTRVIIRDRDTECTISIIDYPSEEIARVAAEAFMAEPFNAEECEAIILPINPVTGRAG